MQVARLGIVLLAVQARKMVLPIEDTSSRADPQLRRKKMEFPEISRSELTNDLR